MSQCMHPDWMHAYQYFYLSLKWQLRSIGLLLDIQQIKATLYTVLSLYVYIYNIVDCQCT